MSAIENEAWVEAAGHNDPKALAVEVLAKHVEANHAE